MEIIVKKNFDLNRLNVRQMIDIGLRNSVRELQAIARENAPIDTGKLKQGIGTEQTLNKARVGPRNIPYAFRREHENKKNPHKKFYMKKTYNRGGAVVKKNFETAYQIVSKKIRI